MNFAGVNHEQTGGRSWQIASAIVQFTGTGLDQAELIFLVPMTRDWDRDPMTATQLDLQIAGSPNVNQTALIFGFNHVIRLYNSDGFVVRVPQTYP